MQEKKAERPHFQPYVDAAWAMLKERDLTPMQLAELLYGRDPVKNTVRGTGHVYGLLGGKTRPGPSLVEAIKTHTDLDLGVIQPLAYVPLPPEAKQKKKKPTDVTLAAQAAMALTPIRAVVEAHKAATQEPTPPLNPPPPTRRGPPVFALSVDQDGTANLTLNLVGVPAEEALRVMAILNSANVIKPKGHEDES